MSAFQVVCAVTLGVVVVAIGLVVSGVAVLWGAGPALITCGALLTVAAVSTCVAIAVDEAKAKK